MLKRGLFITIEGPDGSGKTTVSAAVCQRLADEGYNVLYTREPGGTDISEQIRRIILDPANTAMDAKTEALLYAASRRQHLAEKIVPALYERKTVICDRFIDSSLAYQGAGRNIGVREVRDINAFAIGPFMPDKTIFLDIPVAEGLKRINDGRDVLDRLDQETLAFHEKVYQGYLKVIAEDPDRFVIITALRDIPEVIEEAYRAIRKELDA